MSDSWSCGSLGDAALADGSSVWEYMFVFGFDIDLRLWRIFGRKNAFGSSIVVS